MSEQGHGEKAVEIEKKAVKQLGMLLGRDHVLNMSYNEVLIALNLTKLVPESKPKKNEFWFMARARQLQAQGFNVYINKSYLNRDD